MPFGSTCNTAKTMFANTHHPGGRCHGDAEITGLRVVAQEWGTLGSASRLLLELSECDTCRLCLAVAKVSDGYMRVRGQATDLVSIGVQIRPTIGAR